MWLDAAYKMHGMEKSEISLQECQFYRALTTNGQGWRTSRELAAQAGIASRTGRAFSKKFTDLGLVETVEVFPAHRYRLAPKAGRTNAAYLTRLHRAAEAFGLSAADQAG
mgnify:CR=1 FL=1